MRGQLIVEFPKTGTLKKPYWAKLSMTKVCQYAVVVGNNQQAWYWIGLHR
jgi:hypothetical protein